MDRKIREDEYDLIDFFWMVIKHHKAILASMLVCLTSAIILNFVSKEVYESVAELTITDNVAKLASTVSSSQVFEKMDASGESLFSENAILKRYYGKFTSYNAIKNLFKDEKIKEYFKDGPTDDIQIDRFREKLTFIAPDLQKSSKIKVTLKGKNSEVHAYLEKVLDSFHTQLKEELQQAIAGVISQKKDSLSKTVQVEAELSKKLAEEAKTETIAKLTVALDVLKKSSASNKVISLGALNSGRKEVGESGRINLSADQIEREIDFLSRSNASGVDRESLYLQMVRVKKLEFAQSSLIVPDLISIERFPTEPKKLYPRMFVFLLGGLSIGFFGCLAFIYLRLVFRNALRKRPSELGVLG